MICAGPACQGWLGSGSRRTWQIKSLIIRLVQSQGLRPCINGTSFSRSAKRRSNDGGLTWLTLWPRLLLMYVARSAESHDALTGAPVTDGPPDLTPTVRREKLSLLLQTVIIIHCNNCRDAPRRYQPKGGQSPPNETQWRVNSIRQISVRKDDGQRRQENQN
jgi:hypothetical protein